jgi:hypothetical protein
MADEGTAEDAEDGRIALLVVGLIAVVLALALAGAAITVVHVQDRRLLACADRVAAAASNVVDAGAYYGGEGLGQGLVPSPSGARAAAGAALSELAGSTCSVGRGVVLEEVTARGGEVLVTVSAVADLPLVPPALGPVSAPTLVATSSARTS